jgi:ribosomal protein S18 acetylase RimI-like enzyme
MNSYYIIIICILLIYKTDSFKSSVSSSIIKTSLSWSNSLAEIETNTPNNLKTDLTIKQASFHDLGNVVNLRMNVFFPKFQTDVSFHSSILEKIRMRHVNGAVIFMAFNNDYMNNPIMKLKGGIIGTIELSGTDFVGTDMENMGADRKLYVTDLAVRNDFRRLGVATLLLKAVEEYARKEGYKEIYLHVEVENESAKNLYLRNNYNIVPQYNCVTQFAQSRLVRPYECYVMLSKQIN